MAVALVLALALPLAALVALVAGRTVVAVALALVAGRTVFAVVVTRVAGMAGRMCVVVAGEMGAIAVVGLVELALERVECRGAGLDAHALGDHAPALAAVV